MLIGMDIMRPLRVRIDVTEGTATPAQPDPQTIHLNAAQTQPPQERPLPKPTQALPPPPEAAVSGASLPTPKVDQDSPFCLSNWAGCQQKERTPSLLQPLLGQYKPLDLLPPWSYHLLYLKWLILTQLAVLGSCRQPTFRLKQLVW